MKLKKYKHRKINLNIGLPLSARPDVYRVGPCKTCGGYFETKLFKDTIKQFCRMECYIASKKLLAVLRKKNIKVTDEIRSRLPDEFNRGSNMKSCHNCGKEYYATPTQRKKYCGNICRRKYFDARFDRWIASPQKLAMPQNYDEFLLQGKLPCLVEGCKFVGHQLSMHMNYSHGVPEEEFKKLAGFNLTTGVISLLLQEKFAERIKPTEERLKQLKTNGDNEAVRAHRLPGTKKDYISLEGIEHCVKAQLTSPKRIENMEKRKRPCGLCGTVFYPLRRQNLLVKYCSPECRKNKILKRRETKIPCSYCNNWFTGSRQQKRNRLKNINIYCSSGCMGNGRKVGALQSKEAHLNNP